MLNKHDSERAITVGYELKFYLTLILIIPESSENSVSHEYRHKIVNANSGPGRTIGRGGKRAERELVHGGIACPTAHRVELD